MTIITTITILRTVPTIASAHIFCASCQEMVHSMLVPRAHNPSSPWQGSRALARPDFLSKRKAFVSYSQAIRFARFSGKSVGAFHSTKNSGLTFRIFVCRMERYFPQRRTDLVPFPLEHILLDKNAEGSWKSGCFKRRKLLHRNKFNTYRYSKFFLNIYLTDSNTIFA